MLRSLATLLLLALPAAAQPPGGVEVSTGPAAGDRRVGLRLLGIDFGSGSETDIDFLDPVIPMGLDRLFDWDVRIQTREDAAGVLARYRRPAFIDIEQFSFSWKQLADLPALLGFGGIRDDLYEGVGAESPPERHGFSAGASAVVTRHWGFNARYEETLTLRPGERSLQQVTSAGVAYTPLNPVSKRRRWNYSLICTFDYEELWARDATTDSYDEGFGVSLGPSYQYGLDWAEFPGARRLGLQDTLKLDRFSADLRFNESEIHDFSVSQGVDVTAYATKNLKLRAGVGVAFVPADGSWTLSSRAGLSFRFKLADFTL